LRSNARLIRSEHRDGYRTGPADDTAAPAPRDTWRQQRHGVRKCSRSAWLPETWCSARRQKPAPVELVTWRRAPSMRRRPSDAPRTQTPSRRATRPSASPAPVTDVALWPSPQEATLGTPTACAASALRGVSAMSSARRAFAFGLIGLIDGAACRCSTCRDSVERCGFALLHATA
jgi:hypothetical protein